MAMSTPDQINLTLYRINTGDQREFITKFTSTQTALETFSAQLNPMVSSIAQALDDALQAAEDTRQQAITDTNAIKTQTAGIRDATDQIRTDTAQIQTATQSIYDNEVIPARNATQEYRDEAATIRDQTQAISESGLPSQAGNAGKSLITDGSSTRWDSPLPDKVGNENKALFVSADGTQEEWRTIEDPDIPQPAFESALLYIVDEKPPGSSGGGSASGDYKARSLNTVKINKITGSSLSSGRITLPLGIYYFEASAPAVYANSHRLALYNYTDGFYQVFGTSEYCGGSDNVHSRSFLFGQVAIASSKEFEFRHYTQVFGSNGFGLSVPDGNENTFLQVKIWKVA